MYAQRLAALLVAAIVLSTAAASAENFGAPQAERFFRVEWQAGSSKSGRPAVSGFVYNDYNEWAAVRLVVELLDVSGQTVGRTMGYVNGDVPPRGRAFFEVPLPAGAATHRVTVGLFEWRYAGGGGM